MDTGILHQKKCAFCSRKILVELEHFPENHPGFLIADSACKKCVEKQPMRKVMKEKILID